MAGHRVQATVPRLQGPELSSGLTVTLTNVLFFLLPLSFVCVLGRTRVPLPSSFRARNRLPRTCWVIGVREADRERVVRILWIRKAVECVFTSRSVGVESVSGQVCSSSTSRVGGIASRDSRTGVAKPEACEGWARTLGLGLHTLRGKLPSAQSTSSATQLRAWFCSRTHLGC